MFALIERLFPSAPTQASAPAAVGLAIALGGCGGPKAPPSASWMPDSSGWVFREAEASDSPRWVLYERDALVADVKEFRIVGVLDAEPAVAMEALRYRLLAEEYVPDMLQRRILTNTESEVEVYGLVELPFPMRDREATERMEFTHDPTTGVFRVDATLIDPGTEPPPGVVRAPVIQNSWTLAPTGTGSSVFTVDTVHDMGGTMLNVAIYGAICDGLVDDLFIINDLALSMAGDNTERGHL